MEVMKGLEFYDPGIFVIIDGLHPCLLQEVVDGHVVGGRDVTMGTVGHVSCKQHHSLYIQSLKPESCHDAKFVVTGGTGGCRYDNLRCHQ